MQVAGGRASVSRDFVCGVDRTSLVSRLSRLSRLWNCYVFFRAFSASTAEDLRCVSAIAPCAIYFSDILHTFDTWCHVIVNAIRADRYDKFK